MQTLVRIADRSGQLISYCVDGPAATYAVCVGDHAYRYRTATGAGSAQEVARGPARGVAPDQLLAALQN